MYSESLEDFQGYYKSVIDLTGKAKGIYVLDITTDKGDINKMIVFQ